MPVEERDGVKWFGGSGGPGMFLERLSGKSLDKRSFADMAGTEIKSWSTGKHPITLFHVDPDPDNIMLRVVREWGTLGPDGCYKFRHLISRRSKRCRIVIDPGAERLTVKLIGGKDNAAAPYWTWATVQNSAMKLKNLLLVKYETRKRTEEDLKLGQRWVRFVSAECFEKLRINRFIDEIASGVILIDFDAHEERPQHTALRNHGVKFRVREKELGSLYVEKYAFV